MRRPPWKGFLQLGGILPRRVSSIDSGENCTPFARLYLYSQLVPVRSEGRRKSSQLWREVSAGSVLAKHQATLTRSPGPQLRNP